MSDEQATSRSEEPTRIEIERPAELERYSREWEVSVERIERAVKAVGPLVENVKLYLRIE